MSGKDDNDNKGLFDQLDASEYTLVSIVVDVSSSVRSFKKELIDSLHSIVDACRASARSENILLNVIAFNGRIHELHDFKSLHEVSKYDLDPEGNTALYDATCYGLKKIKTFSENLAVNNLDVNGIVFIITDGYDNNSSYGKNNIRTLIDDMKNNDNIGSVLSVLVGINQDTDNETSYLSDLRHDCNITHYVDIGNSSASNLGKMAQLVSQSIIQQSESLAAGDHRESLVL